MEFMGYQVYGITDIILGATAVAASLAMHLYPMPAFRRIKKRKTTMEEELLTYFPYFGTQFACLIWIVYTTSMTGSTAMAFHNCCLLNVNIFGFVIQLGYLIFYLKNTRVQQEQEDMRFLASQEWICVVCATLILPPHWYNVIFIPKYVGPLAITTGTIMHALHLPSIINEYETKSIKYLPFGMCAIYLLDAVAWFAYSYTYAPTYDVYISIASGIGIVLEIVQLILCLICFMKFRNPPGAPQVNDFVGATQANNSETPLLVDVV